jgi:copper chaperone CopZ
LAGSDANLPHHDVTRTATTGRTFVPMIKHIPMNTSIQPTEKLRFTTTGITCGGCANSVRTILGRMPGVVHVAVDVAARGEHGQRALRADRGQGPGHRSLGGAHHVELNNRSAVIESTTPVEAVRDVVKAIRDNGYDVPTLRRTFPVTGMTCASCVAAWRACCLAQPGVLNAAVNLATNTVQVEYVPGVIDERRCVRWCRASATT